MDIGAQTLAQLSLENKETKFITIEMGSKVSGYTKEYLERLCRLNKVNYRIWNNGTFVIELESLLKETHTILLSYEGITFVDKSELTDPEAQVVGSVLSPALDDISKAAPMIESAPETKIEDENSYGVGSAQPVPRFGGSTFGSKSLAYVGRAVVSDREHPGQDISPQLSTPHAFVLRQITMDEDLPKEVVIQAPAEVSKQEIKNDVPADINIASASKSETISIPKAIHHSIHIPISPSTTALHGDTTQAETIPHTATHIPIAVDKQARIIIPERPIDDAKKAVLISDDWENMLFGHEKAEEKKVELAEPVRYSMADVPSPYRPIKTSVDATEHHDDGMLFPPIKLDAPNAKKNDTSVTTKDGQRVIVFSPEAFPGHETTALLEHNKIDENAKAESVVPPSKVTVTEAAAEVAPQVMPFESERASAVAPVVRMVPTKPVSNASLLPKEPLPVMRVMPQLRVVEKNNLPMKPEEHHMLVREAHPLMKSVGFNVAAIMIVVSSFVLAGGILTGDLSGKLNTESYVAGVGAFGATENVVRVGDMPLPTQTLPPVESNTKTVNMLPFSNDVVVTDGEKPNSVVVQPVFDDGVGKAYQYDIVPVDDSSTSNANI